MLPETKNRMMLLQSAPLNSWVAFSGDETRIVAVAANYMEAVEKSEAAGENDPVILKTPEMWAPLFV